MRRSILAALTLGLVVIGTSGATLLISRWKDRPPAAVVPVRAAQPSARNATAPLPSLKNRIAVSNARLRDAYAAGQIDRPIKTLLNVPSRLTYGDFVWNDRDVPPGPVWVRIDLKSQIISVFRSGHEIGTAVVLYGTDGLKTPTGKFPIRAKLRNHRSATYDIAPMPTLFGSPKTALQFTAAMCGGVWRPMAVWAFRPPLRPGCSTRYRSAMRC